MEIFLVLKYESWDSYFYNVRLICIVYGLFFALDLVEFVISAVEWCAASDSYEPRLNQSQTGWI